MSEFGFTQLWSSLTVEVKVKTVAFGSSLSSTALELCDLGKVI